MELIRRRSMPAEFDAPLVSSANRPYYRSAAAIAPGDVRVIRDGGAPAGIATLPVEVGSSGVYRFSRNPMYLGFLLILAAWAIHLSNALAALFLPAFVVYMNRFQIEPEERVLLAKFGPAFSQYMATVRRWV